MKKVAFEMVWAEERERERIAGELHDHVGHALLLAKMKLDALNAAMAEGPLQAQAQEASSLLQGSILDIRALTVRMRPPILDTSGIETALGWLCTSIDNDYPLTITFTNECGSPSLPVEVRYSLYQTVRELLLNVVKHAGTETAAVVMKEEGRDLLVQVIDGGVGFDFSEAFVKHAVDGGYGLYNVRQRIEQIGGKFAVESAEGKGTVVTLSVPITGYGAEGSH
jgi:signal transduction histidine kinase